MEDSISIKSNDSATASDEFEIVNGGTVVSILVSFFLETSLLLYN